MRPLLRATRNDTGEDIVVKFTSTYAVDFGAEVHWALGEKSLAPKLHAHQKVSGISMAVMEFVEGRSNIWPETPTDMQKTKLRRLALEELRKLKLCPWRLAHSKHTREGKQCVHHRLRLGRTRGMVKHPLKFIETRTLRGTTKRPWARILRSHTMNLWSMSCADSGSGAQPGASTIAPVLNPLATSYQCSVCSWNSLKELTGNGGNRC